MSEVVDRFLDTVYGTQQIGYAGMMTRSESGKLDSERFFSWPAKAANYERIVDMRRDEDVYYSVALFHDRRRSQSDTLATAKIVWADADICEPDKFWLEPSIIVQTSPAHGGNEVCGPRDKTGKPCNGHYHLLWVLDKHYSADEVQNAARKIAYAHKDEGCDLGWTMTKILRVPGTSNTKFDPSYELPDPIYTGKIYTLREVQDAYAAMDDLSPVTQVAYSDVPELLDAAGLEHYISMAGLDDIYMTPPSEGESWSERAFRLQMDLFRFGLNEQEVFTLAENAACNKYNPIYAGQLTQQGVTIPKRYDPHGVLWREIQKVQAEYHNEQVTPLTEREVRPELAGLLTPREEELLEENHSFIDRYSEWVLSRHPDADKAYLAPSAWMVLSNAYGNLCYFDAQYGKVFPNLWVITAGPSSVGHKSAVKNRMIQFTHALEEQNLTQIDIGSDATAETLVTALGARDKEVSLLHIEEIAGFFRETITKNYRSGTQERYTELYDGRVPVVLRATEGLGNKTRAMTVFNLYGVGVDSNITKVLTRENFGSGFLIRAMWSLGSMKPYERGDKDLANNPDEDPNYGDPAFHELVREVVTQQTRSDKERPLHMRMEEDALARINQWTHEINLHALSLQDDVLQSGVERLRDSVVRCATLLSYHNGLKSIGLYETIVAIKQGDAWFRDLQTIVGKVSSTSFSRSCDEVEQFVILGPNKQRTDAAIYKRFGFRPAEFKEITDSLRAQGRIRRVAKQGKWEALD